VLLALPTKDAKLLGRIALVATIATAAISTLLFTRFQFGPGTGGQFQYSEFVSWMPSLTINYVLGVDGIGLAMVLMTTLIFPFIVAVALGAVKDRIKMFFFLILLVETAILGVFDSLNLVLFYIFYEAMLIPLYFIVGIWGGQKRIPATMKFFLYTMVGSVLMLVAIFGVYALTHTFDYRQALEAMGPAFSALVSSIGIEQARIVEVALFLGFFAAFAVKTPIWPLHSWAPDAYVESPVAGTVVFVALKMGLYGFLRFNIALFPHATQILTPTIIVLSVIGAIYFALIACVQTDIKKLIAYSSLSHVNVIAIAIFALSGAGITGAVVQMAAHTFTTGMLFIAASYLATKGGSYEISDYGGVWKVAPFLSVAFFVAGLSAIALPGTAGFTGEFLMLLGTFQHYPWASAIATTAAVWSAVYVLWMVSASCKGRRHPIGCYRYRIFPCLKSGSWRAWPRLLLRLASTRLL
jgi:NADH-quinone oxidoreductase subunit M